ncbi:MAG: Zn-ribbon domain-containing OB-fold protein [Chloroflexota bacterium]
MTQQGYNKPIPVPQPESDHYWEGTKQRELRLRHCKSCDQAYFYPRDICPSCFGGDVDWITASGRGTVYTFAIVHRAPHPGFAEDAPYITALVELEEGPRFPTNLVNVDPDPDKIHIGMPVRVVYEDITEEIALPKFEPA